MASQWGGGTGVSQHPHFTAGKLSWSLWSYWPEMCHTWWVNVPISCHIDPPPYFMMFSWSSFLLKTKMTFILSQYHVLKKVCFLSLFVSSLLVQWKESVETFVTLMAHGANSCIGRQYPIVFFTLCLPRSPFMELYGRSNFQLPCLPLLLFSSSFLPSCSNHSLLPCSNI